MTTTATLRPQWAIAARQLTESHLDLLRWLLVVGALLVAGAHVLVTVFGWERIVYAPFGTHTATWFAFALGITFVVAYLPLHVTSGMTRRSFIRGNLTTSPVMGVLYGLSLFALVAIERAIFDVGLPEQFAALPGWGGSWTMLVSQILLTTVAILSGSLVGITYYRFGGLRGTLLLLLTVLPLLVAILALDPSGGVQNFVTGTEEFVFNPALGITVAAVCLIPPAVAFSLLTRRIPIKAVEA